MPAIQKLILRLLISKKKTKKREVNKFERKFIDTEHSTTATYYQAKNLPQMPGLKSFLKFIIYPLTMIALF